MKIEFSTTEFQASHGRTPKGRGSWAFQICEINGWSGEGTMHFSPSMTFTEAKRWVSKVVKEEVAEIFGEAHHVTVNVGA